MNLTVHQQAADHLAHATLALQAGAIDEAHARISECLKLEPGNLNARVIEARVALARNQPRQAVQALDSHGYYDTDIDPSPEVTLLRIEAMARCGLEKIAAVLAGRFARQFPDDPRAHRTLADLHLRAGQSADAMVHLRRLVELSPSDRAATALLAKLLEADQPDAALAVLGAGDELDRDPAAMLRAARLLKSVDRLRDADEMYERVLTHEPHDANVWLEAGALAASVGAMPLAERRIREALRLGVRDRARAWSELAQICLRAGRPARAGRCWFNASRCDGDATAAWAGILVCAMLTNRPRLRERADRYLTLHASQQERRQLLASLWPNAAAGRVVAGTRLKHDLATRRQATPLQSLLSRSAATLRDQVEQHPRRADAHYHLAVCLDAMGQTEDAAVEVEEALQINPRYETARRFAEGLKAG